MSRAHRAEQRRQARAERRHNHGRNPMPPPTGSAHHGDGVACVTGWCADDDALPELRQKTHDTVISLLGANRRSGVRWHQYQDQAAYDHLEAMTVGCTDTALLELYRTCRGYLREYGGWIVTAMADGTKP